MRVPGATAGTSFSFAGSLRQFGKPVVWRSTSRTVMRSIHGDSPR